LIHLTGTGCISDEREQTWQGYYNPHAWHDIAETEDLYDLPDSAQHHTIDRWFMDAGTTNDNIKTAIICPPDIYGQSRGIGGRETFMVPRYVETVMKKGEVFYLGKGENIRAVTHIDDVVDLFVLMVGEAVKGGGKVEWGREVRSPSDLFEALRVADVGSRVSILRFLMV
jgi:nucleoside-diphosphate-sugar epimerase